MMSSNKVAYKWIAIASVNLAIIGGVVFANRHCLHTVKDTEIIGAALTNIQSQLVSLQREIKEPYEKIDLSAINKDFTKLATLIEQVKTKDESQLKRLINEDRSQLEQKLDVIREVVTSLDKKGHPIKYLPITALPFKVLSIDSIQQVSVASVSYDYKTIPMEKGDTLAGWTVKRVDFGKQCLELENHNKEQVVVNLETEEGDLNA
ncbi:hypothetical protein [Legionella sp.]|uniref:hypothetical protein n=1 Tax=Legionella sp. TaxID=459 RepID=UPI00257D4004|nr:hypothetical protein [Legionella sp.]